MKKELSQPLLTPLDRSLIDKQYRAYRRIHKHRPGVEFDKSIFMLYAIEQKRGRLRLKDVKKLQDETRLQFNLSYYEYKRQLERLKKSRIAAGSGVLYRPAWDTLKLGQRVYQTIKKAGSASPRDLQHKFRISKRDELVKLSLPGCLVKSKAKPEKWRIPRVLFGSADDLGNLRAVQIRPLKGKPPKF